MNNYTNKELAAQCLIEAAELLRESAGRNGVGDRYREEKLKNINKEISDLKNKKSLTEKEEDRLDDLLFSRSYIDGADGSKEGAAPGSKFFGKAYGKKMSPSSVNSGNITLGKQAAKQSKQISDGFGGTEVGYSKPSRSRTFKDVEKYDRSNKKVNPIHKKINDRAQSKNESVDLSSLLREAADLLED